MGNSRLLKGEQAGKSKPHPLRLGYPPTGRRGHPSSVRATFVRSYELLPLQTTCPLCHEARGNLLYTVNSTQAAEHFLSRGQHEQRLRELRSSIEALWGGTQCHVVRCNACSFCHAQPYVSGDANFYRLAFEVPGRPYPVQRWEYQRTYETLDRMARSGRLSDFRLLEVGAGDGAFVKRVAPALIPTANLLCTEYSAYGRRVIQDYGVRCLSGDVRTIRSPDLVGSFDVICMFHVLEHMDDLDSLFDSLNVLTCDQANIFVSVPNPRRIEFNERHEILIDMPPNHIGRWSLCCLELIYKRHGWQLMAHAIEPTSVFGELRKLAASRYSLDQHSAGTVPNRVARVRSPFLRRALQVGTVILSPPGASRTLSTIRLLASTDLGGSLWVHLKKASA